MRSKDVVHHDYRHNKYGIVLEMLPLAAPKPRGYALIFIIPIKGQLLPS